MARQVIQSFRTTNLKHFPTAILFSLLLCKSVASDSSMMSPCLSEYTETINNRTGLVDDKYQVSLQTLLNSLISTSASTSLSFYNTTAGKPPYKSYGIYLCRGDATSDLCRSCVTNLTEWVITLVDINCTERLAYSDHCMLHFANHSFLGRADNRSFGYSYGKVNANFSLVYNQTLEGVFDRVIKEAAFNSTNKFATSEAEVDEHEKVYALAQCTPDIDGGSCSGCLKAAHSYIQLQDDVYLKGDARSGWAMLTSCQLRYDNASFFGSPATSNPAPALPPVSAFLLTTFSLFFINWLL